MRNIRSLLLGANALLAAVAATIPRHAHGYGPLHSRPKGYRNINRLNRSRHWRRARTYAEARALSPYPERPVR